MERFSGFPTRLALTALVPVLLTALAFAVYYATDESSHYEADFNAHGGQRARVLASELALGGALVDTAHARTLLQAAANDGDAVRAALLRTDGGANLDAVSLTGASADAADTKAFRAPLPQANVRSGGSAENFAQLTYSLKTLRAKERTLVLQTALSFILFALVASVLVLLLMRRAYRPIHRAEKVLTRIGEGDYNARLDLDRAGALGALHGSINDLARAVAYRERELADKVEYATAALKAQRDEAAAASNAKSRFLAAASHDLRQPMHALGLFCTALEKRVHEPEQRQLLGNIQTSLQAMEGLFDSLLDLSRLDAGRIHAHIDATPLDELFAWIDLEYATAARDKGLRFRVRRSGLWVQGDITLMRRVVMNLVSNAIRYTSEGGVLIGARRCGTVVRIEVWDTGIGISDEEQTKVFDEFVQADTSDRDKTKGLGLGLAIAQKSAQLMRTDIGLRSRKGSGSKFFFELLAAAPAAIAPARALTTEPESLMGVRVAVVEDDEPGRQALVALLDQWGCISEACESVGQMRTIVGDHGFRPDVLVTDYRLRRDETGFDVIDAVERLVGHAVPVIIVTGELDLVTSEHEQLRPQWIVLKKPVSAGVLRASLQRQLGQREVDDQAFNSTRGWRRKTTMHG